MTPTTQHAYKLSDLTKDLDVTIRGNSDCVITGVSTIQMAEVGHITFLTNSLYRKYLATTAASAVILSDTDAIDYSGNAIISRNPYFTYSQIAAYFIDRVQLASGIHPSAVIDETATIDKSARIGAHCVISRFVKIGAHVVIGAGSVILDHSEIGEDSSLDAHVTVYDHVTIGKRVKITSGAVIGSDGFGFANQKGVWHKVPQLGGVEIGDDVDIGANTAIDRGAIENTVIEEGVKLDNLIQVGHNVRIGAHTVIAGCVAIAGSAVIGKQCMIGGKAAIAGHITICDRAMVTGMTSVSKSIREPGIYSSGIIGAVPNHEFRKNNARFHRLEQLIQRVKNLEWSVKKMIEEEKND
jgi:UDP-3-O-[3-hydroxymyristoyl] glucosamine N-acyltransferase